MQTPSSAPTPPPSPSAQPAIAGGSGGNLTAGPASDLSYLQLRQGRAELVGQMRRLEGQRRELARQLNDPTVRGANQFGLAERITGMDARLADLDRQIATTDVALARAATVPGAIVEPPMPPMPGRNGPPDGIVALGALFMLVAILPISIAFARRIWRRSSNAIVSLPAELFERLHRLEQGMDSMAIEVERVGEGQRFITKVLADKPREELALGAGAAEPVRVKEREPVRERLG